MSSEAYAVAYGNNDLPQGSRGQSAYPWGAWIWAKALRYIGGSKAPLPTLLPPLPGPSFPTGLRGDSWTY